MAEDNLEPARDRRGHFVRTLDTVERDARVAELRAQQMTFSEIADRLGYSHASGARKAYERALKAIITPAAEEARTVEALKLDALERHAWKIIRTMPEDDAGNPLPLRAADVHLAAGNHILRAAARRAALFGLDAPTRLETTITNDTGTDEDVLDLLDGGSLTHQDDGGEPCPKDEPDSEPE